MKRLKINVLDPSSIAGAIEELDKYRKWTDEQTQRFFMDLAKEARDIAESEFAKAPTLVTWTDKDGNPIDWREQPQVTVQKHDNGVSIIADGSDVCFIEFGTGVWADARSPLAVAAQRNLGVMVYPGSWSIDHGRTFQAWEAAGRKGEYRFNAKPARAMLAAYKAIIRGLETKYKEYYDYK